MKIQLSERFYEAAEQWADERVMTDEAALDAKAEQALLEIEHLVANEQQVDYELDGGELLYEPTDKLYAFLSEQADDAGIDPERVLSMYVDLFAGAFLSDDSVTPEDGRGLDPEDFESRGMDATQPEDFDGTAPGGFDTDQFDADSDS